MKITKVSGYVDTPIVKQCGTCEYLERGKYCRNSVVAKDPEVPEDEDTGFKKVDPEDGCCNEWNPRLREVNERGRTHWGKMLTEKRVGGN